MILCTVLVTENHFIQILAYKVGLYVEREKSGTGILSVEGNAVTLRPLSGVSCLLAGLRIYPMI